MMKGTPEGSTHYYGDNCGEPDHNDASFMDDGSKYNKSTTTSAVVVKCRFCGKKSLGTKGELRDAGVLIGECGHCSYELRSKLLLQQKEISEAVMGCVPKGYDTEGTLLDVYREQYEDGFNACRQQILENVEKILGDNK